MRQNTEPKARSDSFQRLVRRCTWCGKSGARFHRRDASGDLHRFHADCWMKHCAFMQSPNDQSQKHAEAPNA